MHADSPGSHTEHSDGAERRRFVVCGNNPVALRLVHELVTQYDGQVVAIVGSEETTWAREIRRVPDVDIVAAERLDAEAFVRAGVADATALAIVDQDDAANVDAALIAQEINPDLRIVIRMFNLGLGEKITQLLNNCAVLSAAAIAAPAFVAAALDDTTTAPMQIADRTLVATARTSARATDVICGLAITVDREEPETLPPDERRADLVLALSAPAPPPRPRRRHPLRTLSLVIERRLRLGLAVFVLLLAAGTAILMWAKGIGLSQAAYEAIITSLGGANSDASVTGTEKIVLTVLSIVSIALIPIITAAVVDAVVKARLSIAAGGLTEPVSDHIVVVGLGDVGTRVVRALHERGLEIVCVERNPDARGVPIVRELRIPLIIGDASRSEILASASVATSRALVIVSTDDVTNLETALLGRAAKSDLRVVMRLFDGEFANRVQRAMSINHSRSVSYLAAPAFAASMLGRQVVTTIAVKRRVLLVADLPVGAGCTLDGAPVSALNRPHEVRLLAIRTGRGQQVIWAPSPGRRLVPTDQLIVVATRSGLSHLLAETAPSSATGEPAAERLLAPWQTPWTPSPRSGESEPLTPEAASD